jgi:hypothetical protein
MNYKISLKNPDPNAKFKWLNVGNFKLNKWGKMSLGLKVTPELAALVLNTENGKWINLAAFEDKESTGDNLSPTGEIPY